MERHFDEELKELKNRLLTVGRTAQRMIGLAVQTLVGREASGAAEVSRLEESVNRADVDIESEVVRLFARRQPTAGDLRLLTAALKIISDLERVADQACNVSETSLHLLRREGPDADAELSEMARLAREMLADSLEAFVRHDPELALDVCRRDDTVDRLKRTLFEELIGRIRAGADAESAVDLILISRNLEKIADHATNIAEEVIFIEEGKSIKHHLASDLPGS